MSGFSGIPLTLPPDSQIYHDIFESRHVTSYLESYVDERLYNGQSLRDGIYFGIKVRGIEKLHRSWTVLAKRSEKEEDILRSANLIIATGHTTIPYMPILLCQSLFRGLVLHKKEFGKATSTILASDLYKSVTVSGGGEGSNAFAGAADKVPYRNGPETAATRMLSAFNPPCFAPVTWWTKLIHGSQYGRADVAKVWLGADLTCRDLANFQGREGALPGFENMKSNTIVFCTGPLGMIQHEDFWGTIAKAVSIYRSNLQTMQASSILLGDRLEILSDALFCDKQVLEQFPVLASSPSHFERPTKNDGIAPLDDDSIAFLAHILVSKYFRNAEAQAIWITVFFN
ncbi:hypothetical protein BDR22DRAFT_961856 [Usnea florida]